MIAESDNSHIDEQHDIKCKKIYTIRDWTLEKPEMKIVKK